MNVQSMNMKMRGWYFPNAATKTTNNSFDARSEDEDTGLAWNGL